MSWVKSPTQTQSNRLFQAGGIQARKRFILGATVLLLPLMTGSFSAYADDRVDARRHFQTGMRLIREEEFEKGVKELEKAYKILPHPTVLYNIGKAWFDAEEFDKAVPYLERYIATDPEDQEEAQRLLNKARIRRAMYTHEDAGQVPPSDTTNPTPVADTVGNNSDSLADLKADLRSLLTRLDQLESGVGMEGRSTRSGGSAASNGAQTSGGSAASKDRNGTGVTGTSSGNGGAPGHASAEGTPAATPGSTGANSGNSAAPGNGSGTEQAPLSDPYALEVITASRYAQRQLESPNAITVISSDEIARSGAVSLPDVLRRIPGMEVMSLNPSDTSLGIRGFNSTLSNKVLVLLDGRSVYLDFLGATLWPMLSISALDIDRIEVIRGPGAALYGAGAFSGVVNIITKTPGTSQDEPQLQVRVGAPDYVQSQLHVSGRQGGTAWRVSGSVDQRQRYAVEVDPEREDYQLTAEDPTLAAQIARLDIRWDRRLAQNLSMSLSGGLANGFSEFMAIGVLRDYSVKGSYGYLRGDLLLPAGFSVRTFWNHVDFLARPWAIPTGGLDITANPRSDIIDVEAENALSFNFLGQHRLNMGLGYRYKSIAWEWIPEAKSEHHLSAFIQDEQVWSSAVNTTLSLRLDRHPVLWNQTDAPLLDRLALSPRAALVWKLLPGHALRANAGTAFRTPTFLENYIEQAIPTSNDAVAVLTTGNESLAPERIASMELGYLHQPDNNRIEIESNVFFNRINGLIVYSEMEPWPSDQPSYDPAGYYYAGTTHPENVNEPETAIGAELGAHAYPMEGVDFYANYAATYIQGGDGSNATVLRSSSPHRLNLGARVSSSGWTFSTDLSLVSSQVWPLRSYDASGAVVTTNVSIPTRTWATARLARRFENHAELAIEGRNLLAPFAAAQTAGISDDIMTLETAAGTVREHPQGQPMPLSFGVTLNLPLW